MSLARLPDNSSRRRRRSSSSSSYTSTIKSGSGVRISKQFGPLCDRNSVIGLAGG